MKRNMLRIGSIALAAAALLAGNAFAKTNGPTLHGFCSSTAPCADKSGHTPTNVSSPEFGFWASPGPSTGDLSIDILVPNSVALKDLPAYAVSGVGSFLSGDTFKTTLVSSTNLWTSGSLADYLGLSSASPNNPIGAYLDATEASLAPGATGFYVFNVDLGKVTLGSAASDSSLMSLNDDLFKGSYVLAFMDLQKGGKLGATANSGAILETHDPGVVPEPSTWAMLIVGMGMAGYAIRRRGKAALAA